MFDDSIFTIISFIHSYYFSGNRGGTIVSVLLKIKGKIDSGWLAVFEQFLFY